MTVPAYCCRCFSNHSTDSASRWFVGSSRRRMSGCWSSKRHSATRRRSPPEQIFTSVSPGGQRSASMAISSLESRSHAPAASSLSCTLACRSMSLSMSASGSAKASLISSNSLRRSMIGCTPCSTISLTVKEIVEQGVQPIIDLLKEFDEINDAFADPEADMDKLMDRQAKVQAKLDAAGAGALDSKLEMPMDALRCPPVHE